MAKMVSYGHPAFEDGDWAEIEDIIDFYSDNFQPVVYIL